MGIFDFFRKKPVEPPQDGPSIHYVLAHYALRQFAVNDPLRYLAILASPQAREFLQIVLDDICEQFPDQKAFAADDLHIHPTRVGDSACAIVEFPPPQKTTEVHFTALVVKVDFDRDESAPPEKVDAQYITLERGVSMDDRPRTVLCGWTNDSHLNFGTGPEPTLHGFIESLEKMQTKEHP